MSGGSEVMTTTAAATTRVSANTNTDPAVFTLTSPSQSQSHMQNMRFSYADDSSAIYKPPYTAPGEGGPPATGIQGINMNCMGDHHHHHHHQQPPLMKKKRGRPRTSGPDGSMGLAIGAGSANACVPVAQSPPRVSYQQHHHVPVTVTQPPQHHQPGGGGNVGGGFRSPPMAAGAINSGGEGVAVSPTSMKKRGRPPGSGKKHQLEALGSAGLGFTPHIITAKAGEDVSLKIMAFSQHGPRAVCILSANGSISNVTLCQPATSGGTVTYEGRFEILSLSGSYLPSEDGGQRSRTGGLSVSLSGPDGRVLGGSVAGLLVAATPVQVFVGSFIVDGGKDLKPVNHTEPLSATMRVTSGGGGSTGASSPQSRGTLRESSGGGPGSPLNQITGACNNGNPQGMSGISWK